MDRVLQAMLMTDYAAYCTYVMSDTGWKPSIFHKFLCDTVQRFVETDTGHAFDILVLSTPPQHGKACADETPVLTKDGWKNHGDLKIGDMVLNHLGEWVRVYNVLPKVMVDRKVTTTSGEEIICHENHEWYVNDRDSHKFTIRETKYMESHIDKRFCLPETTNACETYIESITKVEPRQGNCISVEGGIYCVGRQMIPTHNSVTITETLPSWFLGRNPSKKVIEISYSEDFAKRFGKRNLEKITEYGNEIFGISPSYPASSLDFELSRSKGKMISRGISSGVTGQTAHLMIIDDPIKNRQEADSEVYRANLIDEWLNSFKTRLMGGAKVILIMTRWHENDLAGYILENEEHVTHINIPLEAEENDILGRPVGSALLNDVPEMGKGDEWLKEFKKGYLTKEGSRAWNALFQGRPVALEGNMFKREWWEFYDKLPYIQDWVMSVDAAFKDGEDNDFVAIQVWGKTDADIYLIDSVKKHLNFPDTMREIIRLRATYPLCKTTLIEDKANGSAAIQMLRKELTHIIPVEPKGGKVSRANAIIGAVESHNVHLPKKGFAYDLIDECAKFPNGEHDDQVDAMTQALNRLIYQKSMRPKTKLEDPIGKMFPKYGKSKKTIGKGDKINVV